MQQLAFNYLCSCAYPFVHARSFRCATLQPVGQEDNPPGFLRLHKHIQSKSGLLTEPQDDTTVSGIGVILVSWLVSDKVLGHPQVV